MNAIFVPNSYRVQKSFESATLEAYPIPRAVDLSTMSILKNDIFKPCLYVV